MNRKKFKTETQKKKKTYKLSNRKALEIKILKEKSKIKILNKNFNLNQNFKRKSKIKILNENFEILTKISNQKTQTLNFKSQRQNKNSKPFQQIRKKHPEKKFKIEKPPSPGA